MLEIIGYILSLLIGISLGLIGSGGSILAVPIMVYLFGILPEQATTNSLFIVGITSLIASIKHFRAGNLKIKEAVIFSLPSICTLLTTRKFILPAIPQHIFTVSNFTLSKQMLIMIVFSILMMLASLSMIKGKTETTDGNISLFRLSVLGALIGFVTGFLGAGGGFLIVPALLFYARLNVKQAIATSIFIITINSLIGFTGDVINHVYFDKKLLLIISLIAITGMFIGFAISKKMDGKKLKPFFGWFILVMGIFIIIKELILQNH